MKPNLILKDNDAKFYNEDLIENSLSLCQSPAKNIFYVGRLDGRKEST